MLLATSLAEILKEHPFACGLSPAHLEALLKCGRVREMQDGELIWRQGEPAEEFYLILEGQVEIGITTPDGGWLEVDSVRGGQVLGWSWIVAPYRWHFDARPSRPVRAVGINVRCLREKFAQDIDLHYELLQRMSPIMANRLEASQMRLLEARWGWRPNAMG
jgi:CRP-like cAMP-binding protein